MILHYVGILILVHKDISELTAVLLQYLRAALKQLKGLSQKIVKIQRVVFLQATLVFSEHLKHRFVQIRVIHQELLRLGGLVLRLAYVLLYLPLGYILVVYAEALHYSGYERGLIVIVVYHEVAVPAQLIYIAPEYPCAAGMEGGYPHVLYAAAQQSFGALPHLSGRLICECQRQYVPWGHAVINQIRYAICQRTGLAGACSRQYKQRAVQCFHRLPLLFVKC